VREPSTGKEIFRCPTGCDFNEIELGKEHQSFMAIMDAPYMYLRCGACGHNDPEVKGFDMLSNNLGDAIEKWNMASKPEIKESGK